MRSFLTLALPTLFLALQSNCVLSQTNSSDSDLASSTVSLEELKRLGTEKSRYRTLDDSQPGIRRSLSRLTEFESLVQPILDRSCLDCHGAETQEGNIRIDTLDPDFIAGDDVDWWREVFAAVGNGEMPPPDEGELADEDRALVVDWISHELQVASEIRRGENRHSAFRRMTRYETNYALQDLLGLPFEFTKDLPPDPVSEEGFTNSAETLHLATSQFQTYRRLIREALQRATVRGEQPQPLYWSISMTDAAERAWASQNAEIEKLRQKFADDPDAQKKAVESAQAGFLQAPRQAHYKQLPSGRMAAVHWRYSQAQYAWPPSPAATPAPETTDVVVVLPRRQHVIVELGDQLPDRGTLRVRVRASKTTLDQATPILKLEFGWQASNDSQATVQISPIEHAIESGPDAAAFYTWEVPLSEIYPRNMVRNINQLGDLPSPSEYIRLVNSSASQASLQIEHVEVTAPVYEQWPPKSHVRLFPRGGFAKLSSEEETQYAAEVLPAFMRRAWRRSIGPDELQRKLALFDRLRPGCEDFESTMNEVFTTILASPNFLYVCSPKSASLEGRSADSTDQFAFAERLALFLWSSLPDEELLQRAADGVLNEPEILQNQISRMLADPRSQRFAKHFTHQWLGLQLLEYLKVDRKAFPHYDEALAEAMLKEPVLFFDEMLKHNCNVLDFVHADYTIANERLARHYGLLTVKGNEFRRVSLSSLPNNAGGEVRGGLLTQAGLMAMNSDGKDSHPLKRGIWLLEKILHDPPPPPPPAVPEIDLADPEIAKLTLKEQIEQHRDQAACRSCHAKIDPWGIAFENFGALGEWREQVDGKSVDATSTLFNGLELAGVVGLKRHLLEAKQDQFVRALTEKLTSYALGRPIAFEDYAEIENIARRLRQTDDGLATLVTLIAQSDLFRE